MQKNIFGLVRPVDFVDSTEFYLKEIRPIEYQAQRHEILKKQQDNFALFRKKKTTPLARNDRNDRWAAARAPEAFLIQSPVQASKRKGPGNHTVPDHDAQKSWTRKNSVLSIKQIMYIYI